jgi:hypothetical protein
VKVYVVTSGFDYEDESPVGVAVSLATAKEIAERKATESGYDSATWDGDCLRFGSSYWAVYEMELVGGGDSK